MSLNIPVPINDARIHTINRNQESSPPSHSACRLVLKGADTIRNRVHLWRKRAQHVGCSNVADILWVLLAFQTPHRQTLAQAGALRGTVAHI